MKSETNGEVEELQNAQVYLTPRPCSCLAGLRFGMGIPYN